jgi:hypothetical protein
VRSALPPQAGPIVCCVLRFLSSAHGPAVHQAAAAALATLRSCSPSLVDGVLLAAQQALHNRPAKGGGGGGGGGGEAWAVVAAHKGLRWLTARLPFPASDRAAVARLQRALMASRSEHSAALALEMERTAGPWARQLGQWGASAGLGL